MPGNEETRPHDDGGRASIPLVDVQDDLANDNHVEPITVTVAESAPITIAEALDKAVAVLLDKEILGSDFNYYGIQSSEQIIDYGFKWLIDEQFQIVWDGELGDWWPQLLRAVLKTHDPKIRSLLIEELARIREGLPSLGKQSSVSPGDKWTSPGRLVLTWPDLDPTAQLVLFVMAAHGNNRGENIHVAQQTIADYLGMKKRAIQGATSRLRKAGAITETAKSHQHWPTTYKINKGPRIV